MKRTAPVLVFLATVALWGQPPLAIGAAPNYHLVAANKLVRVYKLEIPGRQGTLLHRHDHDYVVVALGDGKTHDERVGQEAEDRTWERGRWSFEEGKSVHLMRNVSDQPFEAVVVEILRPGDRNPCQLTKRGKYSVTMQCSGGQSADSFPIDGCCHDWSNSQFYGDLILATSGIHPGGSIDKKKRDGFLLVPLTALDVRSPSPGGTPRVVRYEAGGFAWMQGGISYTLATTGKESAEYVTMEFRERDKAEAKR